MKRMIAATALSLGLLASAQAANDEQQAIVNVPLEPVESIWMRGRMSGWTALDRDTLIIWAGAFRPYLVELQRPAHDMRFAHAIGVTEFAGRVHSRFDSVVVRGMRYRIDEMYRLTPEDAKTLRAAAVR